MESGPLLALATALVLGIINSELPSPYWNLNVVENELPFTGLREAALKQLRQATEARSGHLNSELCVCTLAKSVTSVLSDSL